MTPDPAAAYADAISEYLAKHRGKAFTVKELRAALRMGELVVYRGLDRLVYTDSVVVTYRHRPGKRGALPKQYQIA